MKFKIFLTILVFILASNSCQQTENKNTTTGNPYVSLAMTSSSAAASVARLKPNFLNLAINSAYALPPPSSMVDAASNTITIDHIWVNFGQVEFKFDESSSGSEQDGDDVEFDGTYAVDLLTSSPESFVSGNINTSQMSRIKIKLVKTSSLPTGAPNGFLGKSIFISGTVNSHAFSYSTEDESVIEISGPSLLSAVENKTLLIELQIANFIKRINLSAITTSTSINDTNRVAVSNPCPNIENGSSDLFTCFYKGFSKNSNLGRDDDGDFELDEEEDSVQD